MGPFLAYYSAQLDAYTCPMKTLVDALMQAEIGEGRTLSTFNPWRGYSEFADEFNAMFLACAIVARGENKQPPFRRGQLIRANNRVKVEHQPTPGSKTDLMTGVYEVVGMVFVPGPISHWLVEVGDTKDHELRHKSPTLYAAHCFTLEEAPAAVAK